MNNQNAAMWDERYAATELVWSAEPNEFVVEYLQDLPQGRMLDLGGGEGRHALWFAQRGWYAEDSDFSKVAIDKFLHSAAKLSLTDNVVGTVADSTTKESCTTAPVDVVVMAYLQLPATQLHKAIGVAATYLGSGGTLFGVWHAKENLERGYGGPPDPAMLPTMDELTLACGDAGLKVQELTLRTRVVTTDDGPRDAIDVVLLAKK